MGKSVFQSLPARAQASLAELSEAVGSSAWLIGVKAWDLDTASLSPRRGNPFLIAEVDAWANKNERCLYYFNLLSPTPDLLEKVELAFSYAKAHKNNDRAYARLNGESKCFYVGSSRSVARRLKEHLGYGAAGTYALQLAHWVQPLQFSLQFICAKYSNETPYTVIQALEDTLWESKRPMFGRQGRL